MQEHIHDAEQHIHDAEEHIHDQPDSQRSQHVGPASPNIVGCNMLASFEQAFTLQQRDANTKESKGTVLKSDNFPLRRSPLLFVNNL